MNTEKIKTYKKVAEALKEVNEKRMEANPGTIERTELDRAALLLEELSWKVLSDDIEAIATGSNNKIAELKTLSKRIKETYEHLREIGEKIEKTAYG